MIRRLFCFLCAAVVLCSFTSALAEKQAPVVYCYDFDLAFSLNVESFPLPDRERASGYAELLDSLGLKGRLAWCPKKNSMNLEASLYYLDKPSLSYPFRIYGTNKRVFVTSPLINNEDLFLDMNGLMEFAVKAKGTLNMPLTYLAFLYPYATEYAFKKLNSSWNKRIGPSRTTGTVTLEQFEKMSERWVIHISSNPNIQRWIYALMGIAEAPEVIQAEFDNLPFYYENITGGQPLSVSVGENSELWQDASGNTLFSKQVSEDDFSLTLSLPASVNGYIPQLSVLTHAGEETSSFDVSASITLDPSASPELPWDEYEDFGPVTGSGDMTAEYVEEVIDEDDSGVYTDGDDHIGIIKPAQLLSFQASGSGFPRNLPADSSFSASASMLGAVYPNFAFSLQGETKTDGTFSASLSRPESAESPSVEILRVSGTVVSAEPEKVPDYRKKSLKKVFNIFAMNDQSLADFSKRIVPLALRSLLSFVAEAPTSACQSVLDDLTDLGVLGMLLQ